MNAYAAPVVKPGKLWYWLGALLMLVGIIVGAVMAVQAFQALSKTVDGFGRVRVPGGENCKFVFDKAGTYTIYYEFQSTVPKRSDDCIDPAGGQSAETENVVNSSQEAPLDLDIRLVSVTGGTELPTVLRKGDVSFSTSGHLGSAVREVTLPEAGEYRLKVTGVENAQPFVLAIGRGGVFQVAGDIVRALGVAGLGVLVGGLMMIITGTKRRKSRRAQIQMPPTPGPYGQPYAQMPYGQAPAPYGQVPYGQPQAPYGTGQPTYPAGAPHVPWPSTPTPLPPPPPGQQQWQPPSP